MKEANPINPNHETQYSGKAAAKSARNSVYLGRSWTRSSKRRKVKTVVRSASEFKPKRIVEHLNIVWAPKPVEVEASTEVAPVSNPLPMDNSGRFEAGDRSSELSALIEYAIANRPVRYRRETSVVNGVLKTVSVEIPHRPVTNLSEFIEAFPQLKEAVLRIANL